MSGLTSSGRGGAANIVDASKIPKSDLKDLETPTLKTDNVTTGRGGSGNFAKNTDPEETRLRQDVGPVPRRESAGATHVGRGGQGNVFKPEEKAAAKSAENEAAVDAEDDAAKKEKEGLVAKGKQWLLGKK